MAYKNGPSEIPHRTLTANFKSRPDGTKVWFLEHLKYATEDVWVDTHGWMWGKGIVHKPIPETDTQSIIIPRSCILHTNGGAQSAKSLYGYITQAQVNGEPHFQVALDGTVEQYMPVTVRADCNYSANSFPVPYNPGKAYGAISFETQDRGSASVNSTKWELPQIDAMAKIMTVLGAVWGVQCTQPATWDASGIGHHSLFPFQGIGRPAWTNVRGKICPGAARIAQMDFVRAEVTRRLAVFRQLTSTQCGVPL